MRALQDYLLQKQLKFRDHPFFAAIKKDKTFCTTLEFAPRVAFWPLAFQDMLRINEQRIKDPNMRMIAKHHKIEDAGHDKWFLDDLAVANIDITIQRLFSSETQNSRDSSYALMSEVFSITDDRLRVVLLLALESGGHVVFENLAEAMKGSPLASKLKYFSSYHLDVELNHALFEEELNNKLFSITVDDETRQKAFGIVDRSFAAFDQLMMGGIPKR